MLVEGMGHVVTVCWRWNCDFKRFFYWNL